MKEKRVGLDTLRKQFILAYAKKMAGEGNEEEVRKLQLTICLREEAIRRSQKGRLNLREATNPIKHKVGNLVVGKRAGSAGHLRTGIIVETYATINDIYRNPAYVVLCDDGKERVYQHVAKILESEKDGFVEKRKVHLEALVKREEEKTAHLLAIAKEEIGEEGLKEVDKLMVS